MRRFLFWLMVITICAVLIGVLWFFFTTKTPTGTRVFTLPRNPFGTATNKPNNNNQNGAGTPQSTSTNPITNPYPTSTETPFQILEKIWPKPVAGFSFVYIPILITSTSTDKKGREITIQTKATSSLLYFVEKETGNIYSKNLDTGSTTRITNTTIPNVQDTFFLNSGRYVVMRTYNPQKKSIQTFISLVPQVLGTNDPLPLGRTIFLPENILSLTPSYDEKVLYYLVGQSKGSNLFSWSEASGSIFMTSLPLKELLLSTSKGLLLATTKASAFVKGYTLSLPLLTTIYGGRTGLTSNISSSGENILVSMWSSGGLLSFIHSLQTGKDRTLTMQTLAEKCAWDTTSSYMICGASDYIAPTSYGLPDDWYQGEAHFKDSLFLIGVRVPSESKVFNLSDEAKEEIDLIHPVLTTSSSYLGFINKNNDMLWLARIGYILNQTSQGQ